MTPSLFWSKGHRPHLHRHRHAGFNGRVEARPLRERPLAADQNHGYVRSREDDSERLARRWPAFLPKPYKATEIADAIRQLILAA